MGIIFRNQYIDVTDMNGAIKYTNKFVQIDDNKSTSQVFIDRIPLINKVIYDLPKTVGVPFMRGDVVTIKAIGQYATIPEDNIFWVERAIQVGPPLAGWEVGIIGGRVTNATIKTTRLGDTNKNQRFIVEKKVRVTYIPPISEAITVSGLEMRSVLLADPWYNIQEDDILQVMKIDGLSGVDIVKEYGIKEVTRFPTPVPHLHIEIEGSLQ